MIVVTPTIKSNIFFSISTVKNYNIVHNKQQNRVSCLWQGTGAPHTHSTSHTYPSAQSPCSVTKEVRLSTRRQQRSVAHTHYNPSTHPTTRANACTQPQQQKHNTNTNRQHTRTQMGRKVQSELSTTQGYTAGTMHMEVLNTQNPKVAHRQPDVCRHQNYKTNEREAHVQGQDSDHHMRALRSWT